MRGYDSGEWATYRQWASLGAQVKRGEKAATIVFYRELNTPDVADEDAGTRFVARDSHVFNVAQVEGYSPAVTPQITATLDRHAAADAFIAATHAKISHQGARALYRPATDEIVLPPPGAFVGTPTSTPSESYYATALHELTHWTGAESRLARDLTEFLNQAEWEITASRGPVRVAGSGRTSPVPAAGIQAPSAAVSRCSAGAIVR